MSLLIRLIHSVILSQVIPIFQKLCTGNLLLTCDDMNTDIQITNKVEVYEK